MVCAKCGQEILNGTKICPICGASTSHAAGPIISKKRYNMLCYSSIGLLVLSAIQFIFFNPLIASDFSIWNNYAYMRGIPWFICDTLPAAMVSCDLLIIIISIAGVFFANKQRTYGFSRTSGIIVSLLSAGLLVMRIVHGHIIFRSVNQTNYEIVGPDTVVNLQEQYLHSLFIVFVFTAIAAILSFCYIYFSFRFDKPSSLKATKVMVSSGILGLVCGFTGIYYGWNSGKGIPLVAAWLVAAFGVMLIVGIVGLSKRRKRSTRIKWGIFQLVIFTFCILQTIYYAYSAMVQGSFFRDGPFIWITILSGILAVSIPLSAFYTNP